MKTAAESGAKRRRVLSIRWIASGAAAFLTTVSVLAVAGISERNTREALTRELKTRLITEARNLSLTSSGALLSEFPELTLQPIMGEMVSSSPDLEYAVVVDHEGIVRGHPDPRRIGQRFEIPEGLAGVTDLDLPPGERVLESDQLLMAVAPVRHPNGSRIGTAALSLGRARIDAVIAHARRTQAILTVLLLGVGVLSALALMTVILRPVHALRQGLERIGRGDLLTPVKLRDRTELGLLAETMNEMSARLHDAREEMLEKERLDREMELAHEIQASLLPSNAAHVDDFVVEGFHRAAQEVGGDFYDVFELPDGRVGLTIADVSGKGIGGCLVTSMLSVLLRVFRGSVASPSSLLFLLEKHILDSLMPETFITMFYGILDPASGRLTYASAGHSPTFVYSAHEKKVRRLRSRGIPIGADRDGALAETLQDETVELGAGDVLVQYTDGVNEAFDPSGDNQFGFDRLEQAVLRSASRGARSVIEEVHEAVVKWTEHGQMHDDETLLIVSREPAPAGSQAVSPVARPAQAGTDGEALQLLQQSRTRGHHLALPIDIEALARIRGWITHCPELRDLGPQEMMKVESALFEVCANIVEHGYGGDSSKSLDVWYLDDRFVILDHGVPFLPEQRATRNFLDHIATTEGRGIGLELIQRAVSRVSYNPGTPEGNITILGFDSANALLPKE